MSHFKQKYHIETMSAIFIIVLVALPILANFWIGFNLALFVVALTLGMLLAVRYPRSGIYAIIFLTFVFERFFTLMTVVLGRSEYKLYPLDLLLLAVFFSITMQLLGRKISWKLRKADYFFLGFISTAILYFIFSVVVLKNDFALAFSSLKYYAFYPLLTLAIFLLFEREDHLRRLAKSVLAGAFAIVGFIAYGFWVGNGLWSEFTPLSTAGVRTLAFTHAFYLSMAVLVAAAYIAKQKNRAAQILSGVTIIWVVGIVGSMMRHLWIALAAAFAVIFLLALKREKYVLMRTALNYVLAASLAFMLIMYVALLFPRSSLYSNVSSVTGIVGGRVTSIVNSDDESIAWRGVVWKTTMQQYAQSPVFGLGVGRKVAIEIGKYKEYVEVRNIHNSFLVLLVQLGFFGIGLLGYTVYLLVKGVLSKVWSEGQLRMPIQVSLGILSLHLVAFLFQPYLETNLLAIFFWLNLGLLRRYCEDE